jgi:UDP-N-acetylglucosamine 3-dehydrogenase
MINVAVLGAGWAGSLHLDAYSKINDVKIVGIFALPCEQTENAAKKYACKAYYDFKLMFKENHIDVIDICLPTYLHYEYLVKGKEYGVNVLCEKPMVLNISQAKKIYDFYSGYEKKIMFAYSLRFSDGYVKIKEYSESKVFGRLKSLYLYRLSVMPPWSKWYSDENLSGGGVLDLYIHDLDYAYWLLGYPKKINSVGTRLPNSNNWVQAFTEFVYPDETHAMIEVNQNMPKSYPFNSGIRVEFEKAIFVYNFAAQEVKEDTIDPVFFGQLTLYERGLKFSQTIELPNSNSYDKEIVYFIDKVRNDTPVLVGTLDDAFNGVKIVDSIKKSLEGNL